MILGLAESTTKRLLREMVDEGVLRSEGERKGRRYSRQIKSAVSIMIQCWMRGGTRVGTYGRGFAVISNAGVFQDTYDPGVWRELGFPGEGRRGGEVRGERCT